MRPIIRLHLKNFQILTNRAKKSTQNNLKMYASRLIFNFDNGNFQIKLQNSHVKTYFFQIISEVVTKRNDRQLLY